MIEPLEAQIIRVPSSPGLDEAALMERIHGRIHEAAEHLCALARGQGIADVTLLALVLRDDPPAEWRVEDRDWVSGLQAEAAGGECFPVALTSWRFADLMDHLRGTHPDMVGYLEGQCGGMTDEERSGLLILMGLDTETVTHGY